jgi:hypothetical protein
MGLERGDHDPFTYTIPRHSVAESKIMKNVITDSTKPGPHITATCLVKQK